VIRRSGTKREDGERPSRTRRCKWGFSNFSEESMGEELGNSWGIWGFKALNFPRAKLARATVLSSRMGRRKE